MKLDELDNFKMAQIVEVSACASGKRLSVLGCCPGADITIIRRTMAGDTLACELSNYTFGLRRDEANLITVKVLNQ